MVIYEALSWPPAQRQVATTVMALVRKCSHGEANSRGSSAAMRELGFHWCVHYAVTGGAWWQSQGHSNVHETKGDPRSDNADVDV
uniref:Uncharacterized protein n=1 Tax=Oryza barthii TaxID=65489 RepID=A0A0D3FIZ4_9ORYZ